MIRQILMIVDKDSFTTRSIASSLTARHLIPRPCAPQYSALPKPEDCPPAVFLCMQDWSADRKFLMPAIRDLIKASGALLFVAGDRNNIDEIIQHYFPKPVLTDAFYRPFNAVEIAERVDKLYEAHILDPKNRDRLKVPERVSQKRILIVDDNPNSLRALRNVLHAHYKVVITDSGMGALTYLDDQIPDLILLDYEMPILNGPQFLSMIRARERLRAIPVIFLTGKSDRETVMNVMNAKPQGYILKSTPSEEILAKLDAFFEGRRKE